MKNKITAILLGIIAIGTIRIFTPVLAQEKESGGFSVVPFFQEVTLDQGKKEAVFFLTLKNNTDVPAIFRLSVLDFGSLNESGGVAFAGSNDPEKKYGLASWVNLEKDATAVAPREEQRIRVAIENKESLSPGGHYGAIFIRMENDERVSDNSASSVALNQSFTSLIFARKVGGEIYGLELKEKELNKKLFKNPTEINLRFQNTGNVHVVPRGIVKITDPLGREVSRGIVNTESGIILPETFRVFPVKLKDLAVAFFPGKYRVLVEYRYDRRDEFSTEETSFYMIPSYSIIIISAFAGFGLFWFKKNKGSKNSNKKDETKRAAK